MGLAELVSATIAKRDSPAELRDDAREFRFVQDDARPASHSAVWCRGAIFDTALPWTQPIESEARLLRFAPADVARRRR